MKIKSGQDEGGGGQKTPVFVHAQGIKTVQGGRAVVIRPEFKFPAKIETVFFSNTSHQIS